MWLRVGPAGAEQGSGGHTGVPGPRHENGTNIQPRPTKLPFPAPTAERHIEQRTLVTPFDPVWIANRPIFRDLGGPKQLKKG